jgi:5-methylcytosine-specific restriction protein A
MRNTRAPVFKAGWLQGVSSGEGAWRAAQGVWSSRPGGRQRGYDRDWQRLRAAILQAEPMCQHCAMRGVERVAVMVDHITPVRDAPERRLDPTNCQPLCDPCHRLKTNRQDGGYGNARQRGGSARNSEVCAGTGPATDFPRTHNSRFR